MKCDECDMAPDADDGWKMGPHDLPRLRRGGALRLQDNARARAL
jgi:hypothetical protein